MDTHHRSEEPLALLTMESLWASRLLTMEFVGKQQIETHLQRSAGLCFVGCAVGLAGFILSAASAAKDFSSEVGPNKRFVIWPHTVSELDSDFGTARGRLFSTFMTLSGLLILFAWVPFQLDVRARPQNLSGTRLCTVLAWLRQWTAPLGLIILANSPTGNYWDPLSGTAGNRILTQIH